MGLRDRLKRRLSKLITGSPSVAPSPSAEAPAPPSPPAPPEASAPTASAPTPAAAAPEPEPAVPEPAIAEPEQNGAAEHATHGTILVTLKSPIDETIITLEVMPEEYVLDAADRLGEDLPHSCRSGGCLSCAAKLLEGEAEIAEEQYVLEDSDIQQGYRLLCCTTVREPATFLTHQVDEI